MPSEEHVAKYKPRVLGPNLISVTEVRESTRLIRLSHCLTPFSPVTATSPTIQQ